MTTAPQSIAEHRTRMRQIIEIASDGRDSAAPVDRPKWGEVLRLAEQELEALGSGR
ncbi:MAG: hypothetical protein AB7I42_26490 [Bradyrhizobium sp.]|uniref:hypothetical protein n=1 Tax=Bradyrhizobium sp. TaxID=376 RepID=UPI003D0C068D